MEEGVNDRKDDKNKKYDAEKEVEFPDGTSPVKMEESVNNIKDENNEKSMRKKRQNSHIKLPLLILRKV